jgi:hypothetical protein
MTSSVVRPRMQISRGLFAFEFREGLRNMSHAKRPTTTFSFETAYGARLQSLSPVQAALASCLLLLTGHHDRWSEHLVPSMSIRL